MVAEQIDVLGISGSGARGRGNAEFARRKKKYAP